MTEAEWLASNDPAAMLAKIQSVRLSYEKRNREPVPNWQVSDRKLRLFACACCRAVFHLLTDDAPCPVCKGPDNTDSCGRKRVLPHECRVCDGATRVNRSRRAVEVAERYADGLATGEELGTALRGTYSTVNPPIVSPATNAAQACLLTEEIGMSGRAIFWTLQAGVQPATQAALLRDIVWNPWRPWCVAERQYERTLKDYRVFDLAWLTPTVLALAEAVYHVRCRGCERCYGGWIAGECIRPCPNVTDGSLDPDRLTVLADALEEAGCADADLLMHLRGEEWLPLTGDDATRWGWFPRRGPHVRGCWALDLILGKD